MYPTTPPYNSASTACGLRGEYIGKEDPRDRASSMRPKGITTHAACRPESEWWGCSESTHALACNSSHMLYSKLSALIGSPV